ncbi:ATP-grasp domain-containing protein [Urbifossiella limnaea]|uniref:ATP-grasp domain protein n=1 Tax=Urbifossiella limnaea TaxID=2528023 RepID=A0A517XQX3_9BACT|nr:ATP-grasp domain-containing protein [Urbifossiella limnaea]QDU19903.1 ATP-grasp domain protein [Urbifossiella limnaea]
MSDPKPIVGVVGASARAAVHSLARAGYPAWAVDLFTDRDLYAPAARCPSAEYPRGMPALAEQFPPGPVLYTGGLENYPDVVAELAARRPLWGNPPAVLERVRDPLFMGEVWWSAEGDAVRVPRVLPGDATPADGTWLVKPVRGAGGYGIRPFHPADPVPDAGQHYLQESVTGVPMSAVFVASAAAVRLLGVTEQLNNVGWLNAGVFRYGGSVGPVELPAATADTLGRFGSALAWAGGLVGLFGVDFIIDAAGVAWPVEVNPRYTGSVEVIEHATGRAVMLDHATAFGAPLGDWPVRRDPRHRGFGKAVYYAPRRFVFPAHGPWDDRGGPFDPWSLPTFADVPAAGSTIEPGWPVFTLMEGGSSAADVRRRLQSRAADLDRIFAAEHSR